MTRKLRTKTIKRSTKKETKQLVSQIPNWPNDRQKWLLQPNHVSFHSPFSWTRDSLGARSFGLVRCLLGALYVSIKLGHGFCFEHNLRRTVPTRKPPNFHPAGMAHRKGASHLLVNLCVYCSLFGPYRTVDAAEAAPMRAKAAMRKNRILKEGFVCWCIEKIALRMSWWVVVWSYVFFTGDIGSIYNFCSRWSKTF